MKEFKIYQTKEEANRHSKEGDFFVVKNLKDSDILKFTPITERTCTLQYLKLPRKMSINRVDYLSLSSEQQGWVETVFSFNVHCQRFWTYSSRF